ncbi:hypothetical protein [Thalassotalea marina]|uniref:Uncharacterized protein n=1 Tax=Thalassotalea marina TaxID=1673741 RepID=A0A919BDE0_9GAMM|nr:hypothetical protein [Thalassotalea marina]GHF83962.1 hypothetical protein GCM10017161_09150 [Thalassotalea marina]
MSRNKDTDQDKAFTQWLENGASDEFFAQDSDEASLWQDRAKVAKTIAHHADVTPEVNVPNWNRDATFENDKKSWWQWQGLPAMSFAFSLFAMTLVLFKVEVVVQEEGFMLSFAGSHQANQQQQMNQLIDQKLQSFASEQQVILANYASDIKVKQQESNLQLASYIMGASRQERKEDMSEFIKYINEQRADDKFDQQMQLQRLQQTMQIQTNKVQQLGLQAQPANWTTEE